MKLLLLLGLVGCTQVASLNLKKHQFGGEPTKIIWFQVAGFEEEQIGMLRFDSPAERLTSFENNICMGSAWTYNLYDLRTTAQASFLAQITGKKNIKSTCEDAELKPIWSFLKTKGYTTGIIETGTDDKTSLTALARCERSEFLDDVVMYMRQLPVTGAKTYAFSQPVEVEKNKTYYDRTCTAMSCESSLTENFKSIFNAIDRQTPKSLLIVRDFSYLNALNKKDFLKARGILADIERAYGEALNLANSSNDYLVILTTGESKFVDMPDAGKGWSEFEKKGTGATLKRTKLTNMVLSSGMRAENFCGIYGDNNVMERILSGPKQQGLELKFINPFK